MSASGALAAIRPLASATRLWSMNPDGKDLRQRIRCKGWDVKWASLFVVRSLPPHWRVRVGLHVRPVIAGGVGRRKYQWNFSTRGVIPSAAACHSFSTLAP
jgi:hypothetical protein